MNRVAATALVIVMGTATTVHAGDVFRSLAKGVSSAAAEASVQRVAVLPFVPTNGQHPEDGAVLADRLIASLVHTRKLHVVERELLETIMKEHYLTASGIVSPEGRRQIGRILAVDAIVTGSYVSFGRRCALNARLIHVETGDILFAETHEIPIDWFDPYPTGSPWESLLWGDAGGASGCRDAQAQLDRVERELLELKTRYWMIDAHDAAGSSGL